MDIFSGLQDYGWFGILIYFFIKEVSPFVMNKVFPERAAALAAKRATDALLLKTQIERDEKEAEFRRRQEERTTTAIENMSLGITVNNERLNQLITGVSGLSSFTQEAVGDMREAVAKLHRSQSQPKIKAVKQSAIKKG
jgi:hypothetical protein